MNEYTNLAEKLTGRNAQRRKVENHTYLERRANDQIAVRYHETDILTFSPDGTIVVTSGGWQTVSTKARLNEFLPSGVGITQDKGLWYWFNRADKDSRKLYNDGDKLVLSDKGYKVEAQAKRTEKQVKKLRKEILDYAKGFAAACPVEQPSGADCWYCCMITDDGKPLGDSVKCPDHLLKHIKERYYVPSLLRNAIKEFNSSQAVKFCAFQHSQTEAVWKGWGKFIRKDIQKIVARYLYRQLGLPA